MQQPPRCHRCHRWCRRCLRCCRRCRRCCRCCRRYLRCCRCCRCRRCRHSRCCRRFCCYSCVGAAQSAVRHCRRNRKPLDPKLRDALIQRCGPAVQEVAFLRNESKPPFGRVDELAPSRHDRIPPACVVIMFNPFESSFELSYGDSARCLRRTRHFCCRACHRRLLRPAALPLTG